MRDGNVNMGAKFAHSAKSVKLGTNVHWTLLFDNINGSNLGNKCLVSIIRYSKVGRPSVRYFVTISNVLTKLQQDLIKYKQFSLQINTIRQHLTTTTKDNYIHTI